MEGASLRSGTWRRASSLRGELRTRPDLAWPSLVLPCPGAGSEAGATGVPEVSELGGMCADWGEAVSAPWMLESSGHRHRALRARGWEAKGLGASWASLCDLG